jgi:hypothetical protein
MDIQFITHASMLVRTNGISILCDPWLSGRVFNDGWALTTPPPPVDYSTIDYIFISHEHPDHFHFPTLKSIPEAERKRISILYQRHASARMVEAIARLGFQNILELPLYRWKALAPNVKVLCGSVGSMDSFLAVRDSDACMVNLNDCVLNPLQLQYIARLIGSIDVLFTQFSFANWVGNDHDELHGAEVKRQTLAQQIQILKPKFTVPSASFVYFCNEENARMNAWVNTPESIDAMQLPGVNFMYPGDIWSSANAKFENRRAVERYTEDFSQQTIDPTPKVKTLEEISTAFDKFSQALRQRYPASVLKGVDPLSIHIHDLGLVLTADVRDGSLRTVSATESNSAATRFVMCSQVVWFLFNFPWGAGTVEVSGMFLDRERAKQGMAPIFRLQNLLATEVLMFTNPTQIVRTLRFFFDKKFELAARFLYRRKTAEALE